MYKEQEVEKMLDVVTSFCSSVPNASCEKKVTCFECIATALYEAGYCNKAEFAAEVRKDTAATIAADIMLLMIKNENVPASEIIECIVNKYAVKLPA